MNRWSLDRLVAWTGMAALLVLVVPSGVYFTLSVSSLAERVLVERGQSLAGTLAGQIVDPLLLGDELALHSALHRAASTEREARYLYVEDGRGNIVAHTFSDGWPGALTERLGSDREKVVRFCTEDEPLMDISAPILDGQFGTLHVGMSRAQAAGVARRMMWVVGAALAVALSLVFAGAHLVAAKVSRPLRQLEPAFPRWS